MTSGQQDPVRSPSFWRGLLALVSPQADRASLLQDLDEEYRDQVRRRGVAAARRWVRRQAVRSVVPLLLRRLASSSSVRGHRRDPVGALAQDLRYGLRSLAGSPGYSGVVVMVLALGIGANTAIFSLVSPFLFRALPYDEPGRLVHVFETDPRLGGMGWDMLRQSRPTLEAWRQQATSLESIGAYAYGVDNLSRADAEPERITVGRVTVNLLPMLGVSTLHGRLFSDQEGLPGADDVLLIHESLWRSRFGADPEIVGRTVDLDGREHVVVGVLPETFNFPFGSVRMWKPLVEGAGRDWDDRSLLTVARLAPGVRIDTAAAELESLQRRLESEAPEAFAGMGIRVLPLREALIFFYEQLRVLMLLLLGAVAFVLLIVCANVGNLSLARSARRQQEVAVRAALGASRSRIVRQLLAESALLALLAGGLGVLLAGAVMGGVATMMPGELWRVGDIEVDGAALGYTLAVSLATALVFGLLPARRATRPDLASTLKDGHASDGDAGGRRLAKGLVVAQVAVATVLSGGALFMVLAFQELQSVDLGFVPEGIVSLELGLPEGEYRGGDEVRAFWRTLVERAESLPGVRRAAVIDMLPLNFEADMFEYTVPGREPGSAGERLQASAHRVGPGYFEALSIPVLAGRSFEPGDGADAEPVAVVNRLVAERHWPGGGAVGRTLRLGAGDASLEVQIVGVVAPSMGGFVFNGFEEQVFRPLAQSPRRAGHLVVLAPGDPEAWVDELRDVVASLDPGLPVGAVRNLETVLRESTSPLLVASQVLSSFGVFALLLAALGVYGMVAYAVTRRTREIGIRMALGAPPGGVVRLVLRAGAVLVVAGAMLGGALTWLLGAALANGGFGEATLTVPLGVVALLTSVAAVAAWLPARRAVRIDPVIALRAQ